MCNHRSFSGNRVASNIALHKLRIKPMELPIVQGVPMCRFQVLSNPEKEHMMAQCCGVERSSEIDFKMPDFVILDVGHNVCAITRICITALRLLKTDYPSCKGIVGCLALSKHRDVRIFDPFPMIFGPSLLKVKYHFFVEKRLEI